MRHPQRGFGMLAVLLAGAVACGGGPSPRTIGAATPDTAETITQLCAAVFGSPTAISADLGRSDVMLQLETEQGFSSVGVDDQGQGNLHCFYVRVRQEGTGVVLTVEPAGTGTSAAFTPSGDTVEAGSKPEHAQQATLAFNLPGDQPSKARTLAYLDGAVGRVRLAGNRCTQSGSTVHCA